MSAGLHSNAHEARHIPVMLDEVLSALAPRRRCLCRWHVWARRLYARHSGRAHHRLGDRPRSRSNRARRDLMEEYDPRLTLLQGRFGEMAELLQQAGIEKVDGVVLDLGVSSPQIDDAGRGFSFRFDGPLDMRMEKAARAPLTSSIQWMKANSRV